MKIVDKNSKEFHKMQKNFKFLVEQMKKNPYKKTLGQKNKDQEIH